MSYASKYNVVINEADALLIYFFKIQFHLLTRLFV